MKIYVENLMKKNNNFLSKKLSTFFGVVFLFSLLSCGSKGSLYLPSDENVKKQKENKKFP